MQNRPLCSDFSTPKVAPSFGVSKTYYQKRSRIFDETRYKSSCPEAKLCDEMKKMKSLKVSGWIAIVFAIYVLAAQYINILNYSRTSQYSQPSYGKSVVIDSYVKFNNKPIAQIVDDGKNIYILADSHNGYVQVYNTSGDYRFTLSFARQGLNGAFSIACKDDYLYVRDNGHNIYIFQSDQFVDYLEDEESLKTLSHISFKENSHRFKLRFGSVWCVETSKPYCVVERPVYSLVYQYSLDKILIIFGVILLVAVSHKKKPKTC